MRDIREKICEVKDFPKPGIGFKDITPVVLDASTFKNSVDALASWAEPRRPQLIVGVESRGYLFAAPLAYKLGLGMALIRKKGKLPRRTVSVQAPNEYAVEFFEMHDDAVRAGQRVIIIDDLIATGSSSISSIELVQALGGQAAGFGALVELSFLNGVEAIRRAHPEVEVFSVIRFES
ncbi:MAG: adenine phosphoribosyltransferase [Candidatus Aminicenantes bacterium RBG_13_63_10]|nr:MAG: adenine phosphoribosyltransferase [Candidatus Aminicenantes bacterium RBG_13_63_10]